MMSDRNRLLGLDDRQLLAECEFDRYRASGPGGQKRNKTDSAVRLRHLATATTVIAADSRSQHQNRARALRRMRQAIALHVRVLIVLDTYTPSAVLADCLGESGRLVCSKRNAAYHHVVAEILDVLHVCGGQVSTAAERFGISTANLVSFLKDDEKAWAKVNQMRGAAGLKPLR